MLKIVQGCKDSRLDSRVTRDQYAAKVGTRVEHAGELKSRPSCCTIGQKFQAGQAVSSRLELAAQLSCKVKQSTHPVWEKLTFHIPSHPTLYIYPYTHDIERVSRENFKRENLEKNKIDSSTIFTQRLFKFLYSLPLHCQILERYITKIFSHHTHICEKAIWCLGSS